MKNRSWLLAFSLIWLALTAVQATAQSVYTPYTFSTLAGNAAYGSADGTGAAARFTGPSGVAVDNAGNVYVPDTWNNTIRKVTPTGTVTTLAGLAGSTGSTDGTGSEARFDHPHGVAVDSKGNLYVADTYNNTIRQVTPEGVVTTLAGLAGSVGGTDGIGSASRFSYPAGVAADASGNIYVADKYNNAIRKVTPAGVVTTVAGLAGFGNNGNADGTGSNARFDGPTGLAVDSADNIYVADENNSQIRKVTPVGTNWVVTTLAGLGHSPGSADGTGSGARFTEPFDVAVDREGNVYVADTGNDTIRKVTPVGTNWVVTTLAGLAYNSGSADGIGDAARLASPQGVAVDSAGNVYVADTFNSTIRKVTPAGSVTTLAGMAGGSGSADGTGRNARFNDPVGVAVDSAGNVYVADSSNDTIRRVTSSGTVTTLAGLAGSEGGTDGTGNAARFNVPSGVAVDSTGNIFVADWRNHTVRKVTSVGTNWAVVTLAGLAGTNGFADGIGSAARFYYPSGVAVDSAGSVYVADAWNSTIRKVTSVGTNWVVTTLAGLAGAMGNVDGTGSAARFGGPSSVAVDGAGNIYVADTANDTIRKVTPMGTNWVVTTLAGAPRAMGSADGTGAAARFGSSLGGPTGVAVDGAGNLYVADYSNQTVRKVTPDGMVTTLAGVAGYNSSWDGTGSAARFYWPAGVAVDSAGNVYVADSQNHTIRKGYPAPRILSSEPGFGFNEANFGFSLTGPAGQSVVVDTSTDLVTWLPIWTNTVTSTLNFTDSARGDYSNRFYRIHLP